MQTLELAPSHAAEQEHASSAEKNISLEQDTSDDHGVCDTDPNLGLAMDDDSVLIPTGVDPDGDFAYSFTISPTLKDFRNAKAPKKSKAVKMEDDKFDDPVMQLKPVITMKMIETVWTSNCIEYTIGHQGHLQQVNFERCMQHVGQKHHHDQNRNAQSACLFADSWICWPQKEQNEEEYGG